MTDTTWRPDLTQFPGPKYLALTRALREAIRAGELPPGSQLPTVRDLAWDLHVTPGTVSRAYQLATQEGLLAATVGLFRHRRSGLNDPAALPRIERSLAGATLDADWLAAYRAIVGLPVEPALPPLALQIAAAPLHLAILGDARFPFRALGLVHLTQRITQTAPMPARTPKVTSVI